MNDDEIVAVTEFCNERGLPVPNGELLRNRQWNRILAPRWLSWSLDRWQLFGFLSQYMNRQEYASALKYMWSHSEGDLTTAHVEVIFTRYDQLGLSARDFMAPAEQADFDSWPATVDVYRGCNETTRDGLSWTRDINVARAFARQRGAAESPDGTGLVRIGTCNKTEILCYIQNDMNEYEVLILPKRVNVSQEETVTL